MSNKDSPINNLFNKDEMNDKDTLFKQYKLFIEMADRISSRRATMNNFFLTANSLFLVAIGLLVESNLIHWTFIVLIIGIIFDLSWQRLIKKYKKLNDSKFQVINEIEKRLPAKGYTIEWALMKKNKKPKKPKKRIIKLKKFRKRNRKIIDKKYIEITFGEIWIPVTLIIVYGVFTILVLIWVGYNFDSLISNWQI